MHPTPSAEDRFHALMPLHGAVLEEQQRVGWVRGGYANSGRRPPVTLRSATRYFARPAASIQEPRDKGTGWTGAPGDRQEVGGARSHGRLDSDRRARQSEVAKPPTLETTMQVAADRTDASTAIQTDLPAIFASWELSRSTWLITSLSPGAGEKMSKHSIRAGDVAAAPAVGPAQGESARADGAGLPHHRHPRGRIGRLLDPPRSAERRNRKPRCRCRVDFDLAPPAPSEDRRDRWGDAGPHAFSLQTRGAAGVRDGLVAWRLCETRLDVGAVSIMPPERISLSKKSGHPVERFDRDRNFGGAEAEAARMAR